VASFFLQENIGLGSCWKAPIPGRSKLEIAGPSEIVENCPYAGMAVTEDDRAPYFENSPSLVKAAGNLLGYPPSVPAVDVLEYRRRWRT
jgi:hypothetical protein